jgi:hypothetical protein
MLAFGGSVTKKNNEYHLNDWEFETPKEVKEKVRRRRRRTFFND